MRVRHDHAGAPVAGRRSDGEAGAVARALLAGDLDLDDGDANLLDEVGQGLERDRWRRGHRRRTLAELAVLEVELLARLVERDPDRDRLGFLSLADALDQELEAS